MSALPTVFIVEDDEALRDSLHRLLDSVQVQVEASANAQDEPPSGPPNA